MKSAALFATLLLPFSACAQDVMVESTHQLVPPNTDAAVLYGDAIVRNVYLDANDSELDSSAPTGWPGCRDVRVRLSLSEDESWDGLSATYPNGYIAAQMRQSGVINATEFTCLNSRFWYEPVAGQWNACESIFGDLSGREWLSSVRLPRVITLLDSMARFRGELNEETGQWSHDSVSIDSSEIGHEGWFNAGCSHWYLVENLEGERVGGGRAAGIMCGDLLALGQDANERQCSPLDGLGATSDFEWGVPVDGTQVLSGSFRFGSEGCEGGSASYQATEPGASLELRGLSAGVGECLADGGGRVRCAISSNQEHQMHELSATLISPGGSRVDFDTWIETRCVAPEEEKEAGDATP